MHLLHGSQYKAFLQSPCAVQWVAVIAFLSTVAIDTFLVRRFERALITIMEVYETKKQSFIEGVITNGFNYTVPLQ